MEEPGRSTQWSRERAAPEPAAGRGRIFVLYFSILIFLISTFKPGRLIESQQVKEEVEKLAQTLKTNL